jgi:hypothetical protein
MNPDHRCAAPDAAEGVLDLVGQVADQFPAGLLLLQQALFPGGADLLVDGSQLQQQAGLVGGCCIARMLLVHQPRAEQVERQRALA